MAVVIILLIAALVATGTFVEARYDSHTAAVLVYHTVWMMAVLAFLCVTLIAVMIDRLPWKPHHAAFVFAHIGIVLLLLGSYETMKKGVDGSISFGMGQSNKYVILSDTEITLHSSFDGSRYSQLAGQTFDILKVDLKKHPIVFPVMNESIEIIDSMPYALASSKWVAGDADHDGAGIRFQLSNANANLSDWVVQQRKGKDASLPIGPARVTVTSEDIDPQRKTSQNEIVFVSTGAPGPLKYYVFSREGATKKGTIEEGQVIDVGWMGFKLRLLRYFPKARQEWEFKEMEAPTPITTAAIKVRFHGKEQWLQLNDSLKLFSDDIMYVLNYANKRLNLGFDLRLDHFEVGRYQGTMRAASYESQVEVPGRGTVTISMNEPLKYRGYTFYQARFQEDERGKPVVSILSVNKDPGRPAKYLGCLFIIAGTLAMFYFKRLGRGGSKAKENA
jgi:hypothetical protein